MGADYVKVFAGDSAKTKRIELLLIKNDIRPIIKNENESARLAGFGTPLPHILEIYVNKDEEEKTLSLISGIKWEE